MVRLGTGPSYREPFIAHSWRDPRGSERGGVDLDAQTPSGRRGVRAKRSHRATWDGAWTRYRPSSNAETETSLGGPDDSLSRVNASR